MSNDQPQPKIDDLLDRAFDAIGRGEQPAARVLAEQGLAIDHPHVDAEGLLAAPSDHGEIRRLTIMFADLVDSTALSTRIEPETYRAAVGRYKEQVRHIVDRYDGHVASTKGDGLLIVFGHPRPHEDDVRRAVYAGLDIAADVAVLSERIRQRFGFTIQVRVGVHRGVVYLDLEQDDVYGLAANLAARVSGLAPPGGVVVSAAVAQLTDRHFDLQWLEPQPVKGISGTIEHYLVIGERARTVRIPACPIVGRERELAHIKTSWDDATAGALNDVGIALVGEAGIGKSRLAAAAVELAEGSNIVALELTGSPLHSGVGLHPVRRLLQQQCGSDRETAPPELLARLEIQISARGLDPVQLVPLLAPVLGLSAKAGYRAADADGDKLRRRIARAVHDYLLACLGDGPALVVSEDMHWFDADTIGVVQSLLDDDSGRLLVMMTSREAASLPKDPRVVQFTLPPLTGQESDDLIAALYPDLDADGRRKVSRRCDGLPLFIEEVVAKLKEQASDAAESHVPDSLYEALFARLRSHDAVRVAAAAAAIGDLVDRHLLAAAVEIGDPGLDLAIGQLCTARVLEPVSAQSWRFRHELLRDIATELLPPSLRRRMHSRIADAMVPPTAEANTDWPLVATHYVRAERYDTAATAYRKASGLARQRGALNEARSYLGLAISQIELMTPGRERDDREIALRLRRGFLSYAAEGALSQNAAADFERCLQLSGTEVTDDLFSILTALWGHYVTRANLHRAQQVLQAIDAGVVKGQSSQWPTLTAGFGMLAWYRGEFDKARNKLETAASQRGNVQRTLMAGWFMATDPIASIHTHLALARCVQGDLSGAESELIEATRRSDVIGLPQGPFSLSYARQMEVLIRIECGDLDRAAAVAETLTTDARKHGLDSWVVVGSAQQAFVEAARTMTAFPHDHDALRAHIATLTPLLAGWRAAGAKAMITFYDGLLARLLLGVGQRADARGRVDAGLRLAEETGMHFYDAELVRIRAHTQDSFQPKCEDLRAAGELAHQQHAVIFELRAATDCFALCGEAARQELKDATELFPDDSTWPELSGARTLLG